MQWSEFHSTRTSAISSPKIRRQERAAKSRLANRSKNIFMRDTSLPEWKLAAIPPIIFWSRPVRLAGCVCQNTARKNSRTEDDNLNAGLRKITLREIHLPLIAPFETSFGKTSLRRILLVETDVDGVAGWGESTAGEDPYYSYETVETAWHIIRDFLWPILKGKELA